MANSKQIRPSQRNLIWAVAVVIAGVIGALLGGWKLALAAAVIVLVVSEVVERSARRRRLAARSDEERVA